MFLLLLPSLFIFILLPFKVFLLYHFASSIILLIVILGIPLCTLDSLESTLNQCLLTLPGHLNFPHIYPIVLLISYCFVVLPSGIFFILSKELLQRDRDRVCGCELVCVSVDSSRFCLMENIFCLTENVFYFSFMVFFGFFERYFHCSPWCILLLWNLGLSSLGCLDALQCLLSFVFYPAFTACCSRQMVRWCLLLGHDCKHVKCIYVLDQDRVLYSLLFKFSIIFWAFLPVI